MQSGLRLGRMGGALVGFFAWWGGELRACIPRRLRQGGTVGRRLPLDGEGGWIAPAGRGAVTVILPPAWVWQSTLSLPAATAGALDDVLRYEMDRETPFTAAQVRHAGQIVGRSAGEIRVALTVTPRRLIDPVLAEMRAAGLSIVGLAAPGAETLNLLAAEERPRDGAAPRLTRLALLLVALALAGLPVAQMMQQAQLEARLDSARLQASAVARIEARLSGGNAGDDPLLRRRARTPTVTEILAVLSEALPEGTHLDQLRLTGREVQLLGLSATADDLPARLEKSGPFRDVRFLSAVVRDANRGKERFSIGLQLRDTEDKP